MDTPLSVLLKDKGYKIETITPGISVYDCAVKLTQLKVGALLVIDGGKLAGIVSERDILRKIVALGEDAKKEIVNSIMTRELITVTPSTTVGEAMRIVTDKRIRHLPVLESGKLVGIISIGDLTRWAMLLQEQQISSLTNYIQGERSG
ncbi:Inosine-5'-monophosphate dehydrogenase [Aquicella siphonis]|uniref:Inosine-5'-monophosphate dehydrogenase n=1 Tax=Aquicella siphonis TaxID=254247 RepID=A0A5E4PLH1_9COXI|nr:CBS domain-containing protein [Aquicella siphonis]VVC77227.1 Inosine-5'-monophosphate dehydrogenase [Aquicella siphonis]